MKTNSQKKEKQQRKSYVIIHDKNDLLEKLGYPSKKQVIENHKRATSY